MPDKVFLVMLQGDDESALPGKDEIAQALDGIEGVTDMLVEEAAIAQAHSMPQSQAQQLPGGGAAIPFADDPKEIPAPFMQEPDKYGPSVFTREEAPGALPNGTLVRKTYEEEGDATPLGTVGTLIGSLPNDTSIIPARERVNIDPQILASEFAYFIEWRSSPHTVIGCMSAKVEKAT